MGSDEDIEGVLREHMFQKMAQEQEREALPPRVAEHPAQPSLAAQLISKSQGCLSEDYKKELYAPEHESPLAAQLPSKSQVQGPPKPAMSSVAAKRQAKAASMKSVSFGPSDEEIAGLLEDHAF